MLGEVEDVTSKLTFADTDAGFTLFRRRYTGPLFTRPAYQYILRQGADWCFVTSLKNAVDVAYRRRHGVKGIRDRWESGTAAA